MKKRDLEMQEWGYLEGILWGIPSDVDSKTLDEIMAQMCIETNGDMAGFVIFHEWWMQAIETYPGHSEALKRWTEFHASLQEKYGIAKLKQIARRIAKTRSGGRAS
jgi:hypothetical protein